MREIIGKLNLQDTKNNVAQVQEASSSTGPTPSHLLLLPPNPAVCSSDLSNSGPTHSPALSSLSLL